MTLSTNGFPVFLELGQRPDEAGPPIGGESVYPADVTARLSAAAADIVARYPRSRSALLPLLHLVQSEDGYLTKAGIAFCAAQLDLTEAEVTAVATFYSMYRRTPTGDYLVGVCTNTLCAIMGGDAILDSLQEHLGIHAGETTDATGDRASVTLEHIECNAACDYAPVVMVNWEFFDNQTPSSAKDLVDSLRAGEQVVPSRGAPLCNFRDTSRILAGLPDDRPVTADGQVPTATLAGLRVARDLHMEAPAPDDHPPSSMPEPHDDKAEGAEATKDEPAPGPSATVPAGSNTTEETDTSTTDSRD
ncbi:NADH-quinone oxidoreductase subunit NuoE [Mycobacterium sp. 1274761.0]|uniref:NADH-quinone oxidoreductase subunit NuoE n=1 Tax=Mycobacterium sp. 1274761.0 TaxID=1834077 RepID=UPI0007FE59FB|nr:NADH-quinone oxidoreductase subunit NuoE [Mycobacterium sp. 1274761.0]OBK74313.1 NADH-quinone oxidoreductase subunit E [Mycobacterium sp. 1274761.0]